MPQNGPADSPKQKVERGIQGLIDRTHRFFDKDMWQIDLAGLPTFRAFGIKVTRILSLAWQGMVQNDCLTRASALTYITVLSIVPLLAFGFAVAKGVGAYEYLEKNVISTFINQLAPVDSQGVPTEGAAPIRDAAEKILGFVERTNFANLGLLGLAVLLLAAMKLMTKIEDSFNVIWGVQKARRMIRKLTDFVAMVVIAPIVMLATTAITAVLQNNTVTAYLSDDLGLGPVIQGVFRVLPLVMVWLGFSFLYMVMPNTKVPFRSALIGGIVGGTIYQAVQVLYFKFNVGVANYNAIYAGFAAVPIFLVWVYSNWVAVLLGALVAWAHQAEPAYLEQKRVTLATPADRELLAMRALASICAAFAQDRGVTPVAEVAAQCNVPPGVLQEVLAPLVRRGLLARTDDGTAQGFLPARPLDDLRVEAVLDALRGERHAPAAAKDVVAVLDRLRGELEHSQHNLTMRELVDRVDGQPAATRRTS